MIRVQILLTEEQDRRLEKLARRLGTSKAKLVREGVECVLQRKQGETVDLSDKPAMLDVKIFLGITTHTFSTINPDPTKN